MHTEDADSKDVRVELRDREETSRRPDVDNHESIPENPHLQETTELRTKLSALEDEMRQNKEFIQAVLDLRKWESEKAAEGMDRLLSDREHSRAETITLSTHMSLLEEQVMGLYVDSNASPPNDTLVKKLQHLISTSPRLSARLPEHRDSRESLKHAKKLYGPDAELLLLREQLEAQRAENRELRVEMDARAEGKKDQKFRAEVEEAVRQERLKDAFVVRSLTKENQELRKALEWKDVLKW